MKKLTTEQFISNAGNAHGDLYDYSESEYVNAHTKVKIKCNTHGIFEQTPSAHQAGQGCPKCNSTPSYDQNTFIRNANKVHNNKYTYYNCNYINDKSRVNITCSIHGNFEQTARSHLNGRGCNKCYMENKAVNTPSFITKATSVHVGYYNYKLVNYVNAKTKITIICPTHGEFEQTPNDHLNGKGCKHCGFNRLNGVYNNMFFTKFPDMVSTPAKLYCIKITHNTTNEQFWKVGITTLATVQQRYGTIRNHTYEVVDLQYMPLYNAYQTEQRLLNENTQYKYDPLEMKGGHTECFSIPIILPQ